MLADGGWEGVSRTFAPLLAATLTLGWAGLATATGRGAGLEATMVAEAPRRTRMVLRYFILAWRNWRDSLLGLETEKRRVGRK